MADVAISSLGVATNAVSGDYFILNKGDSNTQKINYSALVASLGAGDDGGDGETITGFGFAPVALNFPNAADSTKEQDGKARSADERPEFRDLFNQEQAKISYKMPEGATAAVVLLLYSCSIEPTSLSTIPRDCYANFGYTLNVSSDSGTVEIAPGSKIARGSKLRAALPAWSDVANTPENRRTGMQSGNSVVQRIKFDEGATLTFRPYGEIHRMKACKAGIGSGKVVLLPYNHSDISIQRAVDSIIATSLELDPSENMDDGAATALMDQLMESRELKAEMNYMTNAIRETMTFDTLTAEQEATCEAALANIFALRNADNTDYDYYEAQLASIRESVRDIVGFTFGFQTEPGQARSF